MATTKIPTKEIKSTLPTFTGTTQWYRYKTPFAQFKYTDGVDYLANAAEAFWMLDIIASYQHEANVKDQPFQVFEFTKHEDDSMTLIIQDGNYNELARQEIEYTDFPLDEITLWFVNKVALLPSEY